MPTDIHTQHVDSDTNQSQTGSAKAEWVKPTLVVLDISVTENTAGSGGDSLGRS